MEMGLKMFFMRMNPFFSVVLINIHGIREQAPQKKPDLVRVLAQP